MYRKAIVDLKKWKTKENRKPLILWGARQVGKTYLMKEFGKLCFENVLYISFYNNKRTYQIFEADYDPQRIISELEFMHHTRINPSNTLLIFDEIQEAPKVLESLKYFCEQASEYAIICAGSLLGVSIHSGVSFPVGKVNELHLYPMDFSEYLLAIGEEMLSEFVIKSKDPFTSRMKEEYIKHLKDYYFIGGMPEVVKNFIENKDYNLAREIQNEILSQYEGDFGKHVDAKELPRIKMVWKALPLQLSKENKKFFFGQIKEGARMKDFEIALQWLEDSALIYKVYKVVKPAIPLKSYIDFTSFKVFMLDVGLLSAFCELDKDTLLTKNDVFTEFKGSLTEQFVLQQLIASTNYTPYYYSGDKSTYETDFIIQKQSSVIPIEVKAEHNIKSKSLSFYCQKFNPPYAIRLSMLGYKEEDTIINYPLWAIDSL